jgi:hypothetical protein
MSSVLRTFSQIPVRAKYLLVAASTGGNAVITGDASQVSAFTLAAGAFLTVTSVATVADVSDGAGYAIVTDISGSNGILYKDLGRQITIYDPADHAHLAVFRQVQAIDGAETEGVCNAADYCAQTFVKVWGADGLGVVVVRTG